MKRNIAFWFVVVVLSLTLVVPAQPPTSRVIPFNGYIPGQQDGQVDLRFRIFPVSTGGAPLFEETQTVDVAGETFSILLGNSRADGLPDTLFTSQSSLWIAFALEATPDTQIGPRSPVAASGYAFKAINADLANRANNAERLGDVLSSGYIRTTGGSMSENSSTSILSVTNTGSGPAGIFTNTESGDLIQGRNASDPAPVLRLFNNGGAYFAGNVGIGTTTPGARLQINHRAGSISLAGSALTIENPEVDGGQSMQYFSFGGQPKGSIRVDWGGNFVLNAARGLFILNGDFGGTPVIHPSTGILSINGNVGIGTASTRHRLQVGDGASDGQPMMVRGYGGSGPWRGGAAFGFTSASVIMGELNGVAAIAGENPNLTAWSNLVLNPNGGPDGGNVGIGTFNPRARLDVNGNSSISGGLTVSGNVGIGTTNPQAKLDVDGTTRTKVVEITGGSDLSEQFEVNAMQNPGQASVEPGMVVAIDPDNPGKLVVSRTAYDRRVAGIISGAGGIKPGMLMSQTGSMADGNHPVALTGRVYCRADASNGPIEPGDLLTTSHIPGHAMKVTDYAQAQGAILGKAMTGLKEGAGLVLVLVTLQ